jgi:alkylation response protein AidB-like acyl-CoA dehydrogenase
VNGTKTWISNGIHGSTFAVLVKTDPKAEPRHRGMSLFICEKGPGFAPTRKLEKLGYKGIDSAELVFDEFRVPAANLVGGVEGQGFKHVMNGLEIGRINVAARGVGIARACLEESVAYAQVRKTFGKPICEHQAIQIKLADMATRLEAARHLTEAAATAYDQGRRCDMEAGMAKLLAARVAWAAADNAVQIHGGNGFALEYPVSRVLCDARILSIFEGAAEIQAQVIARRLLDGSN